MMSSENTPPVVHPPKTTTSARKSTPQKLSELAPLKCPRCDSSNTKFCYYNNYNLTQPRHFCKTCRRYWTKGGALRNVPIGGGCRKTKKHKPPSSSSYSNPSSYLSAGTGNEFLAPPTMTPAVEFQLGGISLPRLHPATAGVYTQFIASSGAQANLHQPPIGVSPGTGMYLGLDLLGLGNNYPPTFPTPGNNSSPPASSSSLSLAGGGGAGGADQPLTISSIESLSSINQEMHWKLQQQRLAAMIYNQGQPSVEDNSNSSDQEKPLGGMNLFKSLDNARNDNKIQLAAGLTPTEWLLEQIPSNYGDNGNDHNHNSSSNVGVSSTTTSCNNSNNHQGFNGIWATDLQQHPHQFNGLQ